MYTRLYTRVLNRYHWMYSATAYNHAYNDSGIFCIHASCHPQQMQDLTQVERSIATADLFVNIVFIRTVDAMTMSAGHVECRRLLFRV